MKFFGGYKILVTLPFQEDIFKTHIATDEKIFWILDFSQVAISRRYFFICTLPLMNKYYLGYRILVKLPFQEDIFYMHTATNEKIFWILDFSQATISRRYFYMHIAIDEKIIFGI